ncbi:MAG: hypothetical protein B6D59_05510 [Campylobacteraceae bacterium 4484_4]|nr:MAG: hypothetical protein B6D59_05510 [Campylobacteraceae bacterium 4484_4]
MKKTVIAIVVLLLIGGALFAVFNAKDNYDASRYFAKVTPEEKGLSVGVRIDFKLPDQFDKAHSLSDDTRIVIFSFAKKTGHTVRNFLKSRPDDYLSGHHAMFVADISPMPTIIRNAFALPDLKKSAFSVLLIYDPAIAAKFRNDAKKDQICIVKLDHKKVTDIRYINGEEALKKAID